MAQQLRGRSRGCFHVVPHIEGLKEEVSKSKPSEVVATPPRPRMPAPGSGVGLFKPSLDHIEFLPSFVFVGDLAYKSPGTKLV